MVCNRNYNCVANAFRSMSSPDMLREPIKRNIQSMSILRHSARADFQRQWIYMKLPPFYWPICIHRTPSWMDHGWQHIFRPSSTGFVHGITEDSMTCPRRSSQSCTQIACKAAKLAHRHISFSPTRNILRIRCRKKNFYFSRATWNTQKSSEIIKINAQAAKNRRNACVFFSVAIREKKISFSTWLLSIHPHVWVCAVYCFVCFVFWISHATHTDARWTSVSHMCMHKRNWTERILITQKLVGCIEWIWDSTRTPYCTVQCTYLFHFCICIWKSSSRINEQTLESIGSAFIIFQYSLLLNKQNCQMI